MLAQHVVRITQRTVEARHGNHITTTQVWTKCFINLNSCTDQEPKDSCPEEDCCVRSGVSQEERGGSLAYFLENKFMGWIVVQDTLQSKSSSDSLAIDEAPEDSERDLLFQKIWKMKGVVTTGPFGWQRQKAGKNPSSLLRRGSGSCGVLVKGFDHYCIKISYSNLNEKAW